MKTSGLSLEQAPPLSIPAVFFLTVPLGILLAGVLLTVSGAAPFSSPWTSPALALAHSGTLGMLAMGMLGALYQMTPVVAGSPVPLPRLAYAVHLLLFAGLLAFLWRLLGGPAWAMGAAIVSLGGALLTFALPLGWALIRAPTNNETVQGMRLALASLLAVAVLGLLMARGFAGGPFPAHRALWMQTHATLAMLGWVGALIMSVSWQVIPMFYLAPTVSKALRRWLFVLLLAGLLLTLLLMIWFSTRPSAAETGLSVSYLSAIAAAPAAAAVWLLHPLLILRNIARRKRKRADASLLFWRAGLGCGLLLIPLALAALLADQPRWAVLFGWASIWGWAGLIMHGMLNRIVPFLVWFHRYSARVGFEPVPSMRSLLSQRRIQIGFALHLASLLVGATAIVLQSHRIAQVTGTLLIATAISLAAMLIHVLKPHK